MYCTDCNYLYWLYSCCKAPRLWSQEWSKYVAEQQWYVSKTLFIIPTDARYYKIIEILKQYKNYNTWSDMFRFTQEPSSGSSLVLS